ncbi:MAG: CHRD domain-containing protein, partial [Caulobacteraceae bacterium]
MPTAFQIILDSSQEVGTGSTSTATGLGIVVFDNVNTTLSYYLTIAGLDFGELLNGGVPDTADPNDDVTLMHIHSGARGAYGPVAFDILPLGSTDDADDLTHSQNPNGSRNLSGLWETTDPASTSLTTFAAALGAAIPGNDVSLYFNIHSAQFGGGVIRGQFVCIADDNDNVVIGTNGDDRLPGLGGNDTVSGEDGNDLLEGGDGADILDGGSGDDTLDGGAGDDTLVARYAQVNIEAFDGANGADTLLVYGEVDLRFSSITSIERLTVLNPYGFLPYGVAHFGNSGAGLSSDLVVDGEDFEFEIRIDAGASQTIDVSGWTFLSPPASVTLNGTSGNDTLIGSPSQNNILNGGAGADLMTGGSGSDIYVVDHVDDVVTETGATPNDVVSSVLASYTLPAEIEELWLAGAAQTGVGNALANQVIGTSGANTLQGLSGDDQLSGLNGADTLEGGDGADTLDGGAGADTMDGGAGADTLEGGASADGLNGGDGVDTAVFSTGLGVTVNLQTGTGAGGDAEGDVLQAIENVNGTVHNDTLTGNAGANALNGSDGNDVLNGADGADTLDGGNGDDAVNGGEGDDLLHGGAGDPLLGLPGADQLDGGAGLDTASYAGSFAAVAINLAAGTASGGYATGDTLSNIENIIGSNYNDTLTGSAAANALNGGDGNDLLNGGAGADALDGAGGVDTVSYSGSAAAVTVNLTTNGASGGDAAGDTLSGFENIIGSLFDDILIGNAGANNLVSGGGADTITGGGGVDNVNGGDGDDTINYNFGDGVDAIAGGAGTDTIVCQGNAGGETLDVIWNGSAFTAFKGGAVVSVEQAIADMGAGVDWLRHHNSTLAVSINLAAGAASGFISIANIENAWGSAFNDTLTGSGLANIIRGGAGDDIIDGGAGNDTIVGDDGVDAINGGDDADAIYGLSGADIINGGAGDDVINYNFGDGVDSIDGGAGTDTIVCQGNSGAETLEVAWDGTSFTFFKGGAVSSIEQAIADMGLGGDWLRYTNSTAAVGVNLGANTA